jgi:methionyl-tRNA formyltransferase
MGTPDFAVPSLQALISERYDIKLVVTQPDRKSGRGQKLNPPPVKVLAEENNIPVLQPDSLKKDSEARAKILSTPCDFLCVAAFGQILPKEILDHPKIAPLNVHASLLPAYRGAAPIARSIMEGEVQTGVTIQWVVEALDMGDILFQIPCEIHEDETSETLYNKLKMNGAQALVECLALFRSDHVERKPQQARIGSYAEKLKKEEANISFNQNAQNVHRAIMGMNPWPVAQCQFMGKRMRIFKSQVVPRPVDHAEPGTVIDTSDGQILVACEASCISLLEVQLESKKRMPASEFLKGNPIPQGMILGASS